MIRKLMQSIREFKLFSLLSPLFVVLEVVMEVVTWKAPQVKVLAFIMWLREAAPSILPASSTGRVSM